jgi:hypothetical protein
MRIRSESGDRSRKRKFSSFKSLGNHQPKQKGREEEGEKGSTCEQHFSNEDIGDCTKHLSSSSTHEAQESNAPEEIDEGREGMADLLS